MYKKFITGVFISFNIAAAADGMEPNIPSGADVGAIEAKSPTDTLVRSRFVDGKWMIVNEWVDNSAKKSKCEKTIQSKPHCSSQPK